MARFTRDPQRLNFTLQQEGKEYNLRLFYRAQAIFTTLLDLLPSNYTSAVVGPNYTVEMKAVAVELARLELALEDVDSDRAFTMTRSDFLYSIIGYLMLLNGQIPAIQFNDEAFRSFLLNLVRIYFRGSVPQSMTDAVSLFISGNVSVTENFLLVRQGASGFDISDQFGFQINVTSPSGGGFPSDVFNLDSSIRQILDIIRPAHTLFTIRYIFTDQYLPNDTVKKVLDSMSWTLKTYFYDDFRRYWGGIRDRDRLGAKTNQAVVNEDHSGDF